MLLIYWKKNRDFSVFLPPLLTLQKFFFEKPFFGKYNQNHIVEDFKNVLLKVNPELLRLLHWSKRTLFFFLHPSNQFRKSTYIKPNNVQTWHFSLKTTKAILLECKIYEPLIIDIHQINSYQNWPDTFCTWKQIRKKKVRVQHWLELTQRTRGHSSNWNKRSYWNWSITVKPPFHRKFRPKTLRQSVVQSYRPDIAEPIDVHFHDMLPINSSSELTLKDV